MSDNHFMSLAIKKAWEYNVLTFPNPCVGCAIVKDGILISLEAHKKSGLPHGEVDAIKQAYFYFTNDKRILNLEDSIDIHNFLYENHNNLFNDCILYTTLEPCSHYGKTPPCALLIKNLKFKKAVIGIRDTNKIASGGIKILKEANIEVSFAKERESRDLLQSFIDYSKQSFIFFKYASSINGVIGGGYLSCEQSLVDVHKLRNICDLLVIGGNTVRSDRPTLDARKINGKAPDVLIYSRQKNFDRNIPLFSIENREVFIRDNLDLLQDYKCIMIEGGGSMLKSVQDIVNHFLIYVTPSIKSSDNIKNELELEFLNSSLNDKDIKIWAKVK